MKYRLEDFFSPERWRSVYIWILRFLFSEISNKLNSLERLEKIEGYEIGSILVIDKVTKAKLERIDDFERIHIIEQYMYRFLACPKCVEAKECINCHCKIPERMFVRTDKCSLDYWGPFMDEAAWEKYKKVLNIKFKLSYV